MVWVVPGTPLGAPAALASRIACRSDPDPESLVLVLVTTNCARASVGPRTLTTISAATANHAARTKRQRPSDTAGDALQKFQNCTCDALARPVEVCRPRLQSHRRAFWRYLMTDGAGRPWPLCREGPGAASISRRCAPNATTECKCEIDPASKPCHAPFTNGWLLTNVNCRVSLAMVLVHDRRNSRVAHCGEPDKTDRRTHHARL
jgi:hypothetical protein